MGLDKSEEDYFFTRQLKKFYEIRYYKGLVDFIKKNVDDKDSEEEIQKKLIVLGLEN